MSTHAEALSYDNKPVNKAKTKPIYPSHGCNLIGDLYENQDMNNQIKEQNNENTNQDN